MIHLLPRATMPPSPNFSYKPTVAALLPILLVLLNIIRPLHLPPFPPSPLPIQPTIYPTAMCFVLSLSLRPLIYPLLHHSSRVFLHYLEFVVERSSMLTQTRSSEYMFFDGPLAIGLPFPTRFHRRGNRTAFGNNNSERNRTDLII